ncbi:MAG: hypothetical protein ACI9G1_004672 [Pirellulaceae bacterium]|jgi:hypothetical protein
MQDIEPENPQDPFPTDPLPDDQYPNGQYADEYPDLEAYPDDMYWSSPFLWLFGPLILALQLACVIHVFRTGRPYWWMWIIFAFPMVGMIAYVLIEIRPTLDTRGINKLMWRLKGSKARIAFLQQQLNHSSTIKNRYALAAELHTAGRFEEECDLLSAGMVGAFEDDAQLMMRLAEAQLSAGRPNEAEGLVSQVDPGKSSDALMRHKLLRARVASHSERDDEAETLFKELNSINRTEATRYYYAEHLIAAGRNEEGRKILLDILYRFRRGTVVWRYQEKQWFYAAKKLLKKS